MTEHNLEKLVKITINDFYPARCYTFKKEIKFFGIVFQEEGYYYKFIRETFESKEIPKNHSIVNNILMEDPEVILSFEDKSFSKHYFKSLKEAHDFVRDIKNKVGIWQPPQNTNE